VLQKPTSKIQAAAGSATQTRLVEQESPSAHGTCEQSSPVCLKALHTPPTQTELAQLLVHASPSAGAASHTVLMHDSPGVHTDTVAAAPPNGSTRSSMQLAPTVLTGEKARQRMSLEPPYTAQPA
jgi:hypothetical protein